MTSSALSRSQQQALVSRWREAGRLLDARRRAELTAQSAEVSRQAAWDMLQLGGMLPADPSRERSSGLIEMQRLFARAHRRGRD